ncbi:hypothetical protein SAMN05444858_12361 [Micromonospora avicenniae]|uniref:Uncharacterized protein n=1 Tax=Micromonospora avicenniae TaxID=1198245 RepID=A0A1N7EGY6_9ACTN|nr:hypothetical protein SAMN05444858_12361 [Micromonospora avicenniae]
MTKLTSRRRVSTDHPSRASRSHARAAVAGPYAAGTGPTPNARVVHHC